MNKQKLITGNSFPKEILRALGIPKTTQAFTLKVERNGLAEIEARFFAAAPEEPDNRAELCVAACEGIPDYQLTGENGAPTRLGEVIDSLRATIGLRSEAHPLQTVFDQCLEQATDGKGEERHGHGAPFMEQPWHQIAERQGLGFLVGQAEKKIGEASAMLQKNPGPDGVEFWQKEMRGAINYLGMAMLFVEEEVAALTADETGCGNCEACAQASSEAVEMEYDPATGFKPFPGPYHPDEYRAYNGKTAWLYNPWTGTARIPEDIGTDPFGILIAPF